MTGLFICRGCDAAARRTRENVGRARLESNWLYSASGLALRVLADAPEVPRRADEDVAAGDGRRRERGFAERVLGDRLVLRRRLDDEGLAVVVEEVEVAARGDG